MTSIWNFDPAIVAKDSDFLYGFVDFYGLLIRDNDEEVNNFNKNFWNSDYARFCSLACCVNISIR